MSRRANKNFNATNNKNRNTKGNKKKNNKKNVVAVSNPANKSTAIVYGNTGTTTTDKKSATANSKTFGYGGYSGYSSIRKNYDYKGKKNDTTFPDFVNICKYSQENLKILLERKLLSAGYSEVISGDGYIYAKGTIPVLLTAHMDTVHREPVKDFYEYYDAEKNQHIISSPQGIGGDDRCGIYMILELIKTHKCSVLFCEDEEIGCVGSEKFCKTPLVDELSKLNYFIELDRSNGNDAVFYDCENDEFTDFILTNSGYKDAWGSCSDISVLSPASGIASVNFSCGYYNAHTTSEYVIMEEMFDTILMVRNLLCVESNQFEYIEKSYFNYNGKYGKYALDDYMDDYYGGYYGGVYGGYSDGYYWSDKSKDKKKPESKYSGTYNDNKDVSLAKKKEIAYGYAEEKSLYLYLYDEDLEECVIYVANGITIDDAFGKFFRANPSYCYGDVYDYDYYDCKVREDGWYTWTGNN